MHIKRSRMVISYSYSPARRRSYGTGVRPNPLTWEPAPLTLEPMMLTYSQGVKRRISFPSDSQVWGFCGEYGCQSCCAHGGVSPLPAELQLISYKRYLERTLVQWILSIYPLFTQVAESTFFMKSPV